MNGIVAEDTYQGNSEKVVSPFEKGGLRGICKFKSLSISPVSGTGQALYERERNVLVIQREERDTQAVRGESVEPQRRSSTSSSFFEFTLRQAQGERNVIADTGY